MADTAAASHHGTIPAAADLPVSAASALPAGDDASSSSAPISVDNIDILTHLPFILASDGDNYDDWKASMLSVLAQFGATDHVDPEHARGPGHEEEEEWKRVDVRVVLWIYTTISQELLDEVMAAHATALEVWTQLRGFFEYEEDEQGFDVREAFRNAAQGDLPVDDYCWGMKALADALAGLGEPVEDRVLMMQMLHGLSPRFHVIGASLLASSSVPSFMQAFARMHLAEYDMNRELEGAAE